MLNSIEEQLNAVMWTDLPISSQEHSAQISAYRHVGLLFVNKGVLFGIEELAEY
jgi:hypothetical protein